ncbi:hypothetical protein MTR67_018354 [Solanum verrucosum]|uniref:Tf2-1-like SH3-like domain-containing protein n=1 Tax=Solanum verrucosum TaxID=315347 RepID=A0AAF0TML9_SOLVR|nr:hypothetical protein MTR67_018354 [Solanum verrucosum]
MRGRVRSVLGKLHFLVTLIVRKALFPANASCGSVAAKVHDFVRMNPPEFLGLQICEDPQNTIDEVKKIFGVMQVTGPNMILKKVGKVAYELELLAELAPVHPIFHISLLKNCVGDPASIVPLESVVVKDSLTNADVPVEILDH